VQAEAEPAIAEAHIEMIASTRRSTESSTRLLPPIRLIEVKETHRME
jgi:hypothetical protein